MAKIVFLPGIILHQKFGFAGQESVKKTLIKTASHLMRMGSGFTLGENSLYG